MSPLIATAIRHQHQDLRIAAAGAQEDLHTIIASLSRLGGAINLLSAVQPPGSDSAHLAAGCAQAIARAAARADQAAREVALVRSVLPTIDTPAPQPAPRSAAEAAS